MTKSRISTVNNLLPDIAISTAISIIALSPLTPLGKELYRLLPPWFGLPLFYVAPALMIAAWAKTLKKYEDGDTE